MPKAVLKSRVSRVDESDVAIVCKIVEAAIWYTSSERVEIHPKASS